MKRTIGIIIGCILLMGSMVSSPCSAADRIEGVTVAFNAKTGVLVLHTSQKEVRAYLPQSVNILVKPRLSTEPVPSDWELLHNNLFPGTKVRIDTMDQMVTTIVVLEVPQ